MLHTLERPAEVEDLVDRRVEVPQDVPERPVPTRAVGAVALEKIRLSEALPDVDWEAARGLVRNPRSVERKAEKYADFAPVVASIIASQSDQAVSVIRPTAEMVRAKNWLAEVIHDFLILAYFSCKLGTAF